MSPQYQFHEAHDLSYRIHIVLSRNPYLRRRAVRFEVKNRDVVLTGAVTTYYQKQMAQESLRQINGIQRITNDLQVVSR
ncbi:BON domain-containing protein [Schlesneria paludicola]|uniref:BON domain-containing protein n=1 Tax=Schlesneria paludicola TaxID=360056 RepID=UPI00029A1947|nr:BON domain-containing protein [Schlesneria paludicola]